MWRAISRQWPAWAAPSTRSFLHLLTVPGLGVAALLFSSAACSHSFGWQKVWETTLPRQNSSGAAIGGFSAASYDARRDRLVLLSDLADAQLSTWSGVADGPALKPLFSMALATGPSSRSNVVIDGEAFVIANGQIWLASEGRRSADRPAQLLQLAAQTGALIKAMALPPDWQPSPTGGLESNSGPESLIQLNSPGQPLQLLMAAEKPLRQDPADQVRLLRWWWSQGSNPRVDPPQARAQGALQLPIDRALDRPSVPPSDQGWGLTDLLAWGGGKEKAGQLLALLRRYSAPNTWHNRLALYRLPRPGSVSTPLQSWDLQSIGLTPDNWEGLSQGPPSADGSPSLLLVSDDNLNPAQANRLALLKPERPTSCRSDS